MTDFLVGKTIASVIEAPADHDDTLILRFVDGSVAKFYSSAYDDSTVDWVESSLAEIRGYEREAMGARERQRMQRLFNEWKSTYPAEWFEWNQRRRERMDPTSRVMEDMTLQMLMDWQVDVQRSLDFFKKA